MMKRMFSLVATVVLALFCLCAATAEQIDADKLYNDARNESRNGDAALAAEMFRQLWEMNDVRGAEQLASAYEKGNGVEQDLEKAVELYEAAIALDSGFACAQLGMMYKEGRGVEQDLAKALELFEKSATTAVPERKGPRYAAEMYLAGEGTEKDIEKAIYYYDLGAGFGDITSATALGEMYETGNGIAQDEAKAIEYYRMAALQDNKQAAKAMYALGKMYEKGRGCTADLEIAEGWYQVAAEHESQDAVTALERLNLPVRTAACAKGPDGRPSGASVSDYPEAAEKFQQLVYTDDESGYSIPYNLFLPEHYADDDSTLYPLVIFIADSSVNTDEVKDVLKQNGATVWASEGEQAKHPCIVLAPQYTTDLREAIGAMTTDENVWTDGLTLVYNLIQSVMEEYRVDTTKIYGTGQSQGGMATIAFSDRYPDLYTAQLLIGCQWNTEEMSAMKDDHLWIIVCQGDKKAYPGMNEAVQNWKNLGASVATSDAWDSLLPMNEIEILIQNMKDKNCSINYTVLKDGDHFYSWEVGYDYEGIRDWIFEQSK